MSDAPLPDVTATIEYPYTRTTGPVMGPFLTGLRDGTVLGIRSGDRVICPPVEYDPDTGATLPVDLVPVGPGGTVTTWTWVAEPNRKHPFDHPFAFALVRWDGADTAMVVAVDAGSIDAVHTGLRVAAQFRDERDGAVTDLYAVPEADALEQDIEPGAEPVAITTHLISLEVREPLMPHRQRYLRGLLEGRFVGQRSPQTGKVNIPGRGYDLMSRTPLTDADDVELADTGTVSSFTVITPVQYYGQTETEPYIRAGILLDGADAPLSGVDIRDIPVDEFRVGLRLRAVWRRPEDRDVSEHDNRSFGGLEAVIDRWEPTGEPDVDPDTLEVHVF